MSDTPRTDAVRPKTLFEMSADEVKAWWRGLTPDQRGEVSFYADSAVWRRVIECVGTKERT